MTNVNVNKVALLRGCNISVFLQLIFIRLLNLFVCFCFIFLAISDTVHDMDTLY